MDIEYRKLADTDLLTIKELLSIYEKEFEMTDFIMPPDEHLQILLADKHILFVVAQTGGIVVGGLTAYIISSIYSKLPGVYLYDLAVSQCYQRKGIGKGLLNELKSYCLLKGYRELFVQAEVPDEGANKFYKATGGHAMEVIHYTYPVVF